MTCRAGWRYGNFHVFNKEEINMRMIRFTGLATSGLAVFALAVAGLVTPQVSQAQDGPYTVCSDIPWPPFEMTDEGDNFGFDLDVMRAVAVVEGYDIEIQNLSFDAIIPSLRSGKCDVGASGFTITEKRARVVDFSDPYYLSNQAVLMRKDSDVGLVQALSGGTIGVQRGTTGEAWLKEHLVEQGFDVTLKRYETYPLAVMDLANGRIDAVLQDTGGSKASVAAYPDKLQSAAVINTFEYYGNPVQQGDPNDLLPRISEG